MHSMHLSTGSLVCHGDIKPANILLDEHITTKISDFGLSRLLSTTRHTMNKGCLTPRSDVYSFGVVLLELITRKRVKEGSISLIDNLSKAFAKRRVQLRELFDDEIVNEGNMEALETIGKLANKCLDLNIKNRPRMNVVVEQLRELWKGRRGGQGLVKMSLGIFKMNAVSSAMRTKLQNVKVFTTWELIRITQNYSCLPSHVRIMSQIVHKNIIKLLGYCFEEDNPILVFEYAFASKRCLTAILHGNKDHLSLELRLKIAVQTAQALAYIHSPSTGVTHHGSVVPSNILVDDNFMPKVTGYKALLERTDTLYDDYNTRAALKDDYDDYTNPRSEFKSDVYNFGIVLMELISRKKPVDDNGSRLIYKLRTGENGTEMFDKEISSNFEVAILEQIVWLIIKCTNLLEDERPTMEQVAEYLDTVRRFRKNHIYSCVRCIAANKLH
uniref:Protein kinase domain-containing protein n=1 Tax=Leersia perrieri TaxID=77586 RepID=A0A0D9XT45_9ORYZ